MEPDFIRAKSQEAKKIRLQQLMDAADRLFCTKTYHEITLSIIAQEAGFARGGCYKYVSSKEELFLELFLQKQSTMLEDILDALKEDSLSSLAAAISSGIGRHLDVIKYHQIMNSIIETNVAVEKLADFKRRSLCQRQPLFRRMSEICHLDERQVYDGYLAIIYHSVCLYDRVCCTENYRKAMALAGLEIVEVDFQGELRWFVEGYLRMRKEAEKR